MGGIQRATRLYMEAVAKQLKEITKGVGEWVLVSSKVVINHH